MQLVDYFAFAKDIQYNNIEFLTNPSREDEKTVFGFDPDMIFRIPALLITLTIHEYAHARVAVTLGDPTPRVLGRLTLNPIPHLDPLGLIMLWLFKFGWAKPVPVNPNNFRDARTGMLWVALAGPISNILLAFLTAIIIVLVNQFQIFTGEWVKILWWTYTYNIIFAIFNLLPIPPLDGGKVVSSLLPRRLAYTYERIEPYGTWIILALVWLGVVSMFIRPIEMAMSSFISTIIMAIF